MRMIKKLQQGGMITAPNPAPYRVPLQGLDPNAFKYNVTANPLDTSGMVNVLQFNENADIRRQQQAVLLEQAKIRKEIEEAKLDFQKEKYNLELIQEINKMTAPTGAPLLDTSGNPFLSSIDNTPYIKKHFTDEDAKIAAKQEELQKVMTQFNSDPTARYKAASLANDIAEIRKNRGSDYHYQLELKTLEKIGGILSGDKKVVPTGYKVNPYILTNVEDKRNKFFNLLEPGGWEFGSPANIPAHIMFNPKEQGKAFEEVLTNFLTPVSEDDSKFIKSGRSNLYKKTTTNKLVLDMPSVVNEMTNYVASNPTMASYLSDLLGVNLFDSNNNVNPELLKNSLKGYIEPMYKAAFTQTQGKEESTQILSNDVDTTPKTFNFNYNTNRKSTASIQQTFDATYKGGRVDKKTIENLSNFQVTMTEDVAEALTKAGIDPDRGVGLKVMEEAILKIDAGEKFDKNDALDLAEKLAGEENQKKKKGNFKNKMPEDFLKKGKTTSGIDW